MISYGTIKYINEYDPIPHLSYTEIIAQPASEFQHNENTLNLDCLVLLYLDNEMRQRKP